MTVSEFVKAYYSHAMQTEKKSGISAIFILAQAALESGWGTSAPGNMFFGVKDTDGVNGNEQLLITTEYSQRNDLKFPEIISVTPVVRDGKKYFKYRVKDYFRKYETPEDCFSDHAKFFTSNKRYQLAMQVSNLPVQFATMVAKAGYATDPDYANKLIKIIGIITGELKKIYGDN